jgi:hypothetical protein
MDHAINSVGANEVPRINGFAVIKRIAYQPVGIDCWIAAVGNIGGLGIPAIEQ